MRISGPKLFGPIARRLICPARWKDAYPARPEFAQELEVLLAYADGYGVPNFVPRLEAKAAQRDETLNELRVAYWFDQFGFSVAQWDPPGLGGMVGEYLIKAPEQQNVFVEVKSPGWEGQLTDAERQA